MRGAVEPSIVWHNGELRPLDDVAISPFDRGLTIGLGAFETLVAVDGEPFAFDRHWDRLVHSCRALGLAIPVGDAVAAGMRAVAAANGHGHGRLRVTVTAGPGPLGSDRDGVSQSTCLIVSAPRPKWPPVARVIILPWPRNERSPLAGVKSTSYAENALALAEARRHGADEALFFNTAGRLCEGSGSNVFVVQDGILMTPPLEDGCLAGVTRSLVLELARELGLQVREGPVTIESWTRLSEAFLTSTTREIQPIGRVDGRDLAAAPGPITELLARAWRGRVFPVARGPVR
ncbi:MAG: aminotransferase class IV [Verrucomicrobiales bacterium]